MIENYIQKDWILCNVTALNAKDAIVKAARPLEEAGIILPSYTQDILRGLEEYGPYFVIAKGIALPHARSQAGSLKDGVGLTSLKTPISFQSVNDPVKLIFTLSACNDTHHMELISLLASLLDNKLLLDSLFHASSSEELYTLLTRAY